MGAVQRFTGRLVLLGFGSVAQGALPLVLRHFGVEAAQVTVVKTRPDESGIARALGVRVLAQALTEDNYASVLEPLLDAGDFLLNLSVEVSSLALIRLCWRRQALYLDACNEPWPGRYDNPALSLTQRTNYALREEVLALRMDPHTPTACVTQGANPGLVSCLLKQALVNMARDTHLPLEPPVSHQDWAELASRLGIKAIHIAERDSQVSGRRKARREFVNTWSVSAFVDEGLQPAELGWGSHERHWPPGGCRHGYGCDAAIFLRRPGIGTRVRSWTPGEGAYHGFLVTHAESISIADHLTLRDAKTGEVRFRPTVHYAYHPCDDAVLSLHELAGRNWRLQGRQRILRDEICAGMDELGVLLMGHPRGVYWYGSRLTIEQARALAPYNNATSLQVVAGILGAMAWALRHPAAGLVEPDDLDHATVMELATPYLGELVGVWSDWTPLQDRSALFPERKDLSDPWQFINILVR